MKRSLLTALITLSIACGAVTNDDDLLDDDIVDVEDEPEDEPKDESEDEPQDPVVSIAPADNDSLQDPAISEFVSITGTRNFTFEEEISHPSGDAADFVEFRFPPNSNPNQVVRITLDCVTTGQTDAVASARVFEDGESSSQQVRCNEGEKLVTVNNTKTQTLKIAFSTVADAAHANYTLTVVGFQ